LTGINLREGLRWTVESINVQSRRIIVDEGNCPVAQYVIKYAGVVLLKLVVEAMKGGRLVSAAHRITEAMWARGDRKGICYVYTYTRGERIFLEPLSTV